MGKLSKDQFALAMFLIQQKVSKGIDPPQVLLPEMIPPSERTTPVQVSCPIFICFYKYLLHSLVNAAWWPSVTFAGVLVLPATDKVL